MNKFNEYHVQLENSRFMIFMMILALVCTSVLFYFSCKNLHDANEPSNSIIGVVEVDESVVSGKNIKNSKATATVGIVCSVALAIEFLWILLKSISDKSEAKLKIKEFALAHCEQT